MLSVSTIKLLRIPFSFFLSPVYFFALAQVPHINWSRAILVFFILHFLVYPASNGYNSYMDRDTESIGGLEKPPPPSRQLFITTIFLDMAAIFLSFLISPLFALLIALYISASKAYSYRGIRIKKLPVTGYLFVIVCQGALTFWLVYYGSNTSDALTVPWEGMSICALLIGGFYPLTQIYQHEQDLKDNVKTISYKLGYTGTVRAGRRFWSVTVSTSLWIAAVRARETARPDRLFDDPYARDLAGPHGFTIMAASERAAGGENTFIPVRTLVRRPRPVRRPAGPAGGAPRRRHGHARPPSAPSRRARVVRAGPARGVRRQGQGGGRGDAAVPAAGRRRRHRRGRPTVRRCSRFAADIVGTAGLDAPAMDSYRAWCESNGVPPPFCSDDPVALLAAGGWEVEHVTAPGAPDANYGRLPPQAPDVVPGRTHLVTAGRGRRHHAGPGD